MHDLDRVRLEVQSEAEAPAPTELEAEHFEFGEFETPYSGETGEVFGETENMELASELLEVTNEVELDHFLGGLIARAGQALGQIVRPAQGMSILDAIKAATRKVLPALGSKVGGFFGGPAGARLGGQAAAAAGQAFGLELEGLSGEDREFEIARRYVNFAGEAVKNLVSSPPSLNPRTAANIATTAAAQTHAPGLLQLQTAIGPSASSLRPTPFSNASTSGRWVRRGGKIVLYGV